jgi:carbon storage regulator CsrA
VLVVSRHVDEKVVITDTETGEKIVVLVVSIPGHKVRLGFEALPRFTIHRQEVQDAVDAALKARETHARATPNPAAESGHLTTDSTDNADRRTISGIREIRGQEDGSGGGA